MKKIISITILLLIISSIMFILVSCHDNRAGGDRCNNDMPVATYLGGTKTIDEVSEKLKNAGVSNTEIFKEWSLDFAKTAGKEAKLEDNWGKLSNLNFDLSKCMDGWEKYHDYSDVNCRMTAYLLLDGLLTSKKIEKPYTGTYLMFDLEAIDNVDKYNIIKNNRDLFTTLFGGKNVHGDENPKEIFKEVWENYGIKINSDNVSLLSVVMYDSDFKTVFVGHTGIIVKLEDQMMFVEKIAFEQPYQITKVNQIDELIEMFSKRAEYFGEKDELGPYVYINGDYIGELKRK